MEHLLLASALLIALAVLLWVNRPNRPTSQDEPLEWADIYPSSLISLLKSNNPQRDHSRRHQRFGSLGLNRPTEVPRDYAPWDGQPRDALDEALVLSARS